MCLTDNKRTCTSTRVCQKVVKRKTDHYLTNGSEEEMISVKQRGRMLYSNTPFQSHKTEAKEEMISVKQGGRVLYNNTPFQSHKMEAKEKMTPVKQRGGCYTAALRRKIIQERTTLEQRGCTTQTTSTGQKSCECKMV